MARLIEQSAGIPAVPGNELVLFEHWQDVFDSLIADIDAAQRTCHLEFYIWHPGGRTDEVVEALLRARLRGVLCRVLVDDVGSRDFLRGHQALRLREAGVAVHAALRAGLLRMLFVRFDLRMHRKIAVFDGEIAYTGSLNLVDPRYFKQHSGVGQWVDAMVRVRGPIVEALGITFLGDWELEADEGLQQLRQTGDIHALPEQGTAVAQAIPSGPNVRSEAIQEILLTTIYSARRELVLTTPYFIPDEALMIALLSAARRGVQVTLVVPAKVDSRLVRVVSRAFKGELAAAGVRVAQFSGGLLHTKSITVDGEISLFGSLNLDPRSIYLNFEFTLAVHDESFTRRLRALQQTYIDDSHVLNLEQWRSRSFATRALENGARLMSPLL
jgi:cardiolipin synthase